MKSPLISPEDLAEKLEDSDWVVVDCRFDLTDPAAGKAAYLQDHLPGARYAHLDDDLAAAPDATDGRHPLPDVGVFAASLGGWGISNSTNVVVYDDSSNAIAARLWWMLRWLGHDSAVVLDGGIQGWVAAGLPLERACPQVCVQTYAVGDVQHDSVVRTERIPYELAQGAVLADARSPERYQGVAEPIDPVAGHVPGAVNFPFSAVLQADGRLRPAELLARDMQHLVAHPRGLIAMCGSGVTACLLLLALDAAGLGEGRVYLGSWSEWIRDSSRPVATGDEVGVLRPMC